MTEKNLLCNLIDWSLSFMHEFINTNALIQSYISKFNIGDKVLTTT